MSRLNSNFRQHPGRPLGRTAGFFTWADATGHAASNKSAASCRSGGLRILLAALIVTTMAAVGGFLLFPQEVSADSGGFTTQSFDVNVETDEDHTFHVSEEIHVDFNEYRHGLYRYIPDGGRYYGVRNIRVQGYTYDVYSESGNVVIQIGDPGYTVYGEQTYRITYDIVGYADDSREQDYLSIDLLPTGWSTSIDSASLRISFPKKVDDIESYAGVYGTSGSDAQDTVREYFSVNNTGTVYTAESKEPLPRGLGLTIKADLPEGYWAGAYSRESNLPLLLGVLAVMGMLMLLLWLFVGRDQPIIQTVEFYPPEEMDPMEIAYIGNDTVKSGDISAQFIYMASKGYLQVQSEGKKNFVVTRLKDPEPTERGHTRKLFRALFSRGDAVRLKKLPEKFGDAAAEAPGEVRRTMESRRPSFSLVSKAGRVLGLAFCLLIPLIAALECNWLLYGSEWGIMFISFILALVMFVSMSALVAKTDAFRMKKNTVRIIIGFILFLAAAVAETLLLAGTGYVSLAAVFLCSELAAAVATIFVRRRMNNEIYGRVLGFREFIRTAEYDRLKMLSEEDPEYFFNIMPYACVFGMSNKWADKFSDFRIPPPTWYQSADGSWDPYFTYYMYSNMNSGVASALAGHYRAVSADMLSGAVDTVSSGGGFSGGGFSGGGFGGGGGGSW